MKVKLFLMLLATVLVAGVTQANMLLNPSFEQGAFEVNLTPDHWVHYYTTYSPAHTWINNSAEAHSGNK